MNNFTSILSYKNRITFGDFRLILDVPNKSLLMLL